MPRSKALRTKSVNKTKTDARSNLKRLKARIVAYENEEVLGVVTSLTFATFISLSTVEVILALAAT